MNVKELSKKVNGTEHLTKDFQAWEFACKDGTDKFLIDLEALFSLQKIRNILGIIDINSAYRTISHNKKVGGGTNSYHLKGQAFDIIDRNQSVTLLCNIAYTLGFKGIIRYPDFVHVDTRTSKYHANNKGTYLTYYTTNIPFDNVLLKIGVTSNDVGVAQFKLKSLGYDVGKVDGIYGTKTENAVVKYQQNNKLKVDGIIGNNTWSKLFS